MKILSNNAYEDLKNQIKSAENSADKAHLELSRKNGELLGKDIKIENLEEKLKKKNDALRNADNAIKTITEQRDIAEERVKILEEENHKKNSSKGGYVKHINSLNKEIEELKVEIFQRDEELAKKDKIIENYKVEMKKMVPKKTVLEYERRTKRK